MVGTIHRVAILQFIACCSLNLLFGDFSYGQGLLGISTPKSEINRIIKVGTKADWDSMSQELRDDIAKYTSQRLGGLWVIWRHDIDASCDPDVTLIETIKMIQARRQQARLAARATPWPTLPLADGPVKWTMPDGPIPGTAAWLRDKGTVADYLSSSDFIKNELCDLLSQATVKSSSDWKQILGELPKRKLDWHLTTVAWPYLKPKPKQIASASATPLPKPQPRPTTSFDGYAWNKLSYGEKAQRAKNYAVVTGDHWLDLLVELDSFYGESNERVIMQTPVAEAVAAISILMNAN